MEKLKPKPCPFCGSQPVVKQSGTLWMVICEECVCSSSKACGETEREAIAGWNRRCNDGREG